MRYRRVLAVSVIPLLAVFGMACDYNQPNEGEVPPAQEIEYPPVDVQPPAVDPEVQGEPGGDPVTIPEIETPPPVVPEIPPQTPQTEVPPPPVPEPTP